MGYRPKRSDYCPDDEHLVELSDGNGNHIVGSGSKSWCNGLVKLFQSALGALPDDSSRYTTGYYGARQYDHNAQKDQFRYSTNRTVDPDEDLEDSHDAELDEAMNVHDKGTSKWIPW